MMTDTTGACDLLALLEGFASLIDADVLIIAGINLARTMHVCAMALLIMRINRGVHFFLSLIAHRDIITQILSKRKLTITLAILDSLFVNHNIAWSRGLCVRRQSIGCI
jgi:hypothetical protein